MYVTCDPSSIIAEQGLSCMPLLYVIKILWTVVTVRSLLLTSGSSVYCRADRSVSFRMCLAGLMLYLWPTFSVQQRFIFADISLWMVPGISPFPPHCVACHPALGRLPASWSVPDQYGVSNSVNEGSEGQNYRLHVDI